MERQAVLIVAKELLSSNRISTTAVLLLAQLLDHRNKRTGQCNPKRKTLSRELGLSEDTIDRALKVLCKAGYLTYKRSRHCNQYEIQMPQNAAFTSVSDAAKCGVQMPQNAVSGPPYPLYEPIQGEPKRSRAEARFRGVPPSEQSPNAALMVPGAPRKDVGLEWDPLGGKFLTKTQMQQLTWAIGLENNRRRNERELAEKARKEA